MAFEPTSEEREEGPGGERQHSLRKEVALGAGRVGLSIGS